MPEPQINASPTKSFFIENLTRDLTLEDAILDLVDNSIDAAVHSHSFDVSAQLLEEPPPSDLPTSNISLTIDHKRVVIEDDAGGIAPSRAINDVFRLGRVPGAAASTLGVYGIGLKRAVFKMGRRITLSSWHPEGAFQVTITPEWLADEGNWDLPLTQLPARMTTGTRIVVEELRSEIQMRVRDSTLLGRLKDALSATYGLFLGRFVALTLNGTPVPVHGIPVGRSDAIAPGVRHLSVVDDDGDIDVKILVGLSPRGGAGWAMKTAGWYVVCNGRVVVFADKTELTGWGIVGPQFTPKYRGFVGIAYFFSHNPRLLPWTTTKRGLNRESHVFQLARMEMIAAARPVLTFLNDMYPSEATPEVVERELADSVEDTPLHELTAGASKAFTVERAPRKRAVKTVSVQYKARKSDIERAKKCLAKPSWSAGKVGAHALSYLLDQECPDE